VASGAFGARPVALRHDVVDHPAFRHDALVEVAERIPSSWGTGYKSGDQILDHRLVRLGAPAQHLARDIETNGVRLTLYHLDHISPYRDLAREHLDVWETMTGEREGGTTRRTANAFIGAPGAVVPAHFDRHHNVLLQIRGTKVLTVGWFPDETQTRRETEREFDQRHHGIRTLPPETVTFRLGPGDGVYIPAYAFHWVVGGPDVSVALSCGYSTAVTDRAEVVHLTNARLRQLRLPARPPGRSTVVDKGKVLAYRSAMRVQSVRRRTRTAP
jgi:hypothetical protein